jgi:Mor family transcriptional regulator
MKNGPSGLFCFVAWKMRSRHATKQAPREKNPTRLARCARHSMQRLRGRECLLGRCSPITKALYLCSQVKRFDHWGMNLSDFKPVDLDRATDAQLSLVDALLHGAPEIWRDIAELNFVALRFCGIFKTLSDDELAQMSVNLVHQLVASFGGATHYIPCGKDFLKLPRNEQIKKEFNGTNYQFLSKKFHVTEMRIRQIVNYEGLSLPKKHYSKASG